MARSLLLAGMLGLYGAEARAVGAESRAPASLDQPVDALSARDQQTRHARVSDPLAPASTRGQVWRDYDLRPYLSRSKNAEQPEQELIDWILRETGTERWFGATPGMIALEGDRLRIYQTPEVHQTVRDIIDRYVNPDLAVYSVTAKLVTVESANWRAQAQIGLRPVRVQTPGVEAWLMPRETAAVILAQLRSRVDFREHNAGVQIPHGQHFVLERWQPRTYPQAVDWGTMGRAPQVQLGQLSEGFRLQLSPLAQADGETMDCVIRCQAEQIERLAPVWLDDPRVTAKSAGFQIEVPQVSSWRIQERFRWPVDEVLLISRGMVAMPGLRTDRKLPLPAVLGGGPPRADALLFLECRDDRRGSIPDRMREARAGGINYRGRY